MPPMMYIPEQGGVFHGLTGTFKWYNGHPPNTPPHNPRNAYQWRVKVGSTQYGFDYYLGYPVAGTQTNDPNVSCKQPPPGQICWTVVEWNTVAGGTWYAGTPTSFNFS